MPKNSDTPKETSRRSKGPSTSESGWKTAERRMSFFGGLIRILILCIVLLMLILPFTPYASKIKQTINDLVEKARKTKVVIQEKQTEILKEVIKEVEVVKEVSAPPTPLPSNFIPRKEVDVATFYNGITIKSTLDAQQGTYASVERKDKEAYTVEFEVKVRVPKASDNITELARVNPELPKMLPGLTPMMEKAKVSGFYHKLYENKVAGVQKNITRLNKVLDRHNFFDCETILELTHPQTNRKALLIQSEMDVVADGSDGDRMPVMSADIYDSDYYQPSTSYEWAKKGSATNPLLPRWQTRLENVKKEYAQKGLSAARNTDLKNQMQHAENVIRSLKTRSSLIAEKDPFIVLSLLFRGYAGTEGHTPVMGDYAAVIHEGKIYPAICGDYGPTMKMGEASLMMAKQINEKATPYIRPESDLKVTYLVFPGTAEKPFGPPDLEKWHEKVSAYLADCGGLAEGYVLHKWENPFPPKVIEPVIVPTMPVLTSEPGKDGTATVPTTTPAAASPTSPPPATNSPTPSVLNPAPGTPPVEASPSTPPLPATTPASTSDTPAGTEVIPAQKSP